MPRCDFQAVKRAALDKLSSLNGRGFVFDREYTERTWDVVVQLVLNKGLVMNVKDN